MSVNLCVQFYVIAAADGERVTDLSRAESRASEELCYGSGPDRQRVFDRAVEALTRSCQDLAVEQHLFRLPHGHTCCSEIGERVREVCKLPFDLYGALSPAQLRMFRDALRTVVAERGETKMIASLQESRRLPKTAASFLTLLRHVLDSVAPDHYLVIKYEDGVWDLDDAPAGEPTPFECEGDSLEDTLARIARAVGDGRVSKRERQALVRAVKRVPKGADQIAALLDLAELLREIEAKLSSR